MKRNSSRTRPVAFLALWALVSAAPELARAQWVITGSTPGGGNAISGTGCTGPLPSGSLAAGGFNQVTLQPGGQASDPCTPITFTASNETLTNFGVISSTGCGPGVRYCGTGGLTHPTLQNSGLILGGTGRDGVNVRGNAGDLGCVAITNSGGIVGGAGPLCGGYGIYLQAGGAMTNVTVCNSGTLGGGFSLCLGGDALGLSGGCGPISGLTLKNSGSMRGGDGVQCGGYGFSVFTCSGLKGATITNSGLIAGGIGNLCTGGDGIGMPICGGLSDLTVSNSGTIAGGPGTICGGYGLLLASRFGPMQNVTVANSGSILGGASPCEAGAAVRIFACGSPMDGVQVHNSGIIAGGSSPCLFGGIGLCVESCCSDITNLVIANSGSISGGTGTFGAPGVCVFACFGNISTLTFNNSGSISGGSSPLGAGYGVGFGTNCGSLVNVNFTNSGQITGGVGAEGGTAVCFLASGISCVQLTNSGYISGGSSHGLNVDAYCGNLTNMSVFNSGTITGASGGSAIYLGAIGDVNGLAITNAGKITAAGCLGYGLWVDADSGDINQLNLNNSGTISGANCAGHGVYLQAGTDLKSVFLANSGTITGGSFYGAGVYVRSSASIDGLGLVNSGLIAGGICGGAGVYVRSDQISNIGILNHGTIMGGPAVNGVGCCCCCSGAAGDGIRIATMCSTGLAITNFGTISGGAGNPCVDPGAGVNFDTGAVLTGSLTINNWGIIAGGAGSPMVAIQLNCSSNNVVNLNGHSSTRGLITADGINNYLNLNFTGLSPAEITRITADLNAQNVLNGEPSTGSVVIRGETVVWDPLIVSFNGLSYQLQGTTPNQQALGTSLDSLTANPTPGSCTANLLNAIDLSGNVPQALSALSPQSYQIYGDIAKASANLRVTEVNRRLSDLRTGSASETRNTTATAGDHLAKGGFFTTGYGTFANLDGNADIAGARFTSSGVITGVDHRYSDKLVAGALLNFTSTHASLDGVGSGANVQGVGAGAYAGYQTGGWFANALATYDRNSYSSNRRILFPGFDQVTVARTDGDQLVADLDVGHNSRLSDRWTAGPELGLQYVYLGVDGFTESGGAGAALSIGRQSVNAFRTRLGGRASYTAPFHNDRTFALELRGAWQHDCDDSNRLLASFGGGFIPFTVGFTPLARDTALAGVGANLTGGDLTSYIRYDIQAGNRSSQQYASAGVRLRF